MKKFLLISIVLVSFLNQMKAEKWDYHFYTNMTAVTFVNQSLNDDPWILTMDKLLMHFENNKWKVVLHKYDVVFDKIKVDSKGKIWAWRDYNSPLYFYENNTWDSISTIDSIFGISDVIFDKFDKPYINSNNYYWSLEGSIFQQLKYTDGDSTYTKFQTVLFDKNNILYAYDGYRIAINPMKKKTFAQITNAGKLMYVDENAKFYFNNKGKLSIYEGSTLLKDIVAPANANESQTGIYIKNLDDIYFLYSFKIFHYVNNYFSIDSNYKMGNNRSGYLDAKGNFWVSKYKALYKFSKDSIESFKTENIGLRSSSVGLAIKYNGSYIISYSDSLPTLYQNEKYIHLDSTINIFQIASIINGKENEMWGIGADSLYHYYKMKWEKVLINGKGIYTDAICYSKTGILYLFSKSNLHKYNGSQWSTIAFPYAEFISLGWGSAILQEDKVGSIWLSLFERGLFKFDTNSWYMFDTSNTNQLGLHYIFSMGFDSKNNLFAASAPSQLLKYNGEVWTKYDTSNSNTKLFGISSLAVDKNDKVWIGQYEPGVEYFDGVSFHSFKNIAPKQVFRIQVFDNNDKWFFSKGIITIYNEKDEEIPPAPIPIVSTLIKMYPNPLWESLTIENLKEDDQILITDIMGRKVWNTSIANEGVHVLDIAIISNGLYIVDVLRDNKIYYQQKVVKK